MDKQRQNTAQSPSNAEVWYKAEGIEFGVYPEEPRIEAEEPKEHFEYDIVYITVDGRRYHINDNVDEADAIYLYEMDAEGKPDAALRLHGKYGAVLAAYSEEWQAGRSFMLFDRPCNTEQFCHMIAYAIRSGKRDFNIRELENKIIK